MPCCRLGGYAAVSLFGIGAAFGLITPLLEIGGNSQHWTFLYIPALASLMIAAIGWLALLSGPARLARRRAEAGSEPASSRGAERRGA